MYCVHHCQSKSTAVPGIPLRRHGEVLMAPGTRLAERRAFWLRMARESLGWSQAAVARRLGMSPSSAANLSRFESNTRQPSLGQLERFAHLYGLTLSFLAEPPETAHEVLERERKLRT